MYAITCVEEDHEEIFLNFYALGFKQSMEEALGAVFNHAFEEEPVTNFKANAFSMEYNDYTDYKEVYITAAERIRHYYVQEG